jgi:hypothetical protein
MRNLKYKCNCDGTTVSRSGRPQRESNQCAFLTVYTSDNDAMLCMGKDLDPYAQPQKQVQFALKHAKM